MTPLCGSRRRRIGPDAFLFLGASGQSLLHQSKRTVRTMDEIRCEIRLSEEVEGKPTRLVGVLMDYGTEARDRREVFEASALKWDGPLILNRQHSRKNPILKFTPIEASGRVSIDVEVPSTVAGSDAVEEIRSGLFSGISIEFKSIKEVFVGGVRRISEAVLTGAGLVDTPAYSSSVVEARAKAARRESTRHTREFLL